MHDTTKQSRENIRRGAAPGDISYGASGFRKKHIALFLTTAQPGLISHVFCSEPHISYPAFSLQTTKEAAVEGSRREPRRRGCRRLPLSTHEAAATQAYGSRGGHRRRARSRLAAIDERARRRTCRRVRSARGGCRHQAHIGGGHRRQARRREAAIDERTREARVGMWNMRLEESPVEEQTTVRLRPTSTWR
jgi:hypothetical protein